MSYDGKKARDEKGRRVQIELRQGGAREGVWRRVITGKLVPGKIREGKESTLS